MANKIPKTLDKIMDSKLDKLPLSAWTEAQSLWDKLRKILETGNIRE